MLLRKIDGLRALAPQSAVACLNASRGAISKANSCAGPWTQSLSLGLTIDAYRLGLQNRGQFTIAISNPLAGLDQLLHGSNGLRGWGQSAWTDPVLLQVRAFDPAARRFIAYDVNNNFGRSSQLSASSPFRISLDYSLDVGPDRERRELFAKAVKRDDSTGALPNAESLRRRLPPAGTPGPFAQLAARTDTIKFSPEQAAALARAEQLYMQGRDSLYAAFIAFVDSLHGVGDDRKVHQVWRETWTSVAWRQWEAGQGLTSLWADSAQSAASRRRVAATTMQARLFMLTKEELRRWLSNWINGPIP